MLLNIGLLLKDRVVTMSEYIDRWSTREIHFCVYSINVSFQYLFTAIYFFGVFFPQEIATLDNYVVVRTIINTQW